MDNYQNQELCTKCQGRCCKTIPGTMSPEEIFQPSTDIKFALRYLFSTGLYTIGHRSVDSEGTKQIYYIRPRIKHSTELYDPSVWGGTCVFWTSKGCKLRDGERPEECRLLEPKPDGKCISHTPDKNATTRKWIPYQELLKEIVNREEKDG